MTPTFLTATLFGSKGTAPNHGPRVAYRSPVQVTPFALIVATYHVGAPYGSKKNIVAKIVLLRRTNWMPQPDSPGIHHRSLWSAEYEALHAGETSPASANVVAATTLRMTFM